jgi:hypothetical protein
MRRKQSIILHFKIELSKFNKNDAKITMSQVFDFSPLTAKTVELKFDTQVKTIEHIWPYL